MLTLSNVSFGYQNRPLFKEVSFSLSQAKMLHLKGPNGSGKSTLMYLIAGLMSPDSGDIKFSPSDQKHYAGARAKFIEYLSAETNGHYIKLSALDNLMFWTRLRGLTLGSGEIKAELEKWGLGNPFIGMHLPVAKFSTGMKRRLALARLSLSKTSLWLLDEPLYGLDSVALSIFGDLTASHLKNGGSVIFISHEMSVLKNHISGSIDIRDFGAL